VNSVTEVLTKAKQYLTLFGWRQNEYGNPSTGFCLTGAIRAAVDVTDENEINLPPILNDVYAAFTRPLQRRGKVPYRYSEALPHRACSPKEIELYREPFADAGEVIEYNDYVIHNQSEAIALLDEAIIEASKSA
jgi:hypothetical protein